MPSKKKPAGKADASTDAVEPVTDELVAESDELVAESDELVAEPDELEPAAEDAAEDLDPADAGGADEPDDTDGGDDELDVAAPAPVERPRPAPRPTPPAPRIPTGPPVSSTQALEHGRAAAGAKLIKPGFATTKAGDLAFALGFPHLEYIIDDHPDDARAEMIAYERRSYRLGWPRNVAIRWCRTTACKGFKRTPQGATELDTAGKKAIKNAAPISTEEVSTCLKSIFSDTSSYEDLRDLVRLFEAFVGPELVTTSIIDALEKSSTNVWNHQDHDRAQVMHHLGFLLLRLPANLADKLRSRLAAVFDRRVKALPNKELGPRKGERGSLLRALDVVLNGRTGAERSGERNQDAIVANDLVHVTNDEAFVREAACRVTSPDARLVFLGGEAVLDHVLDSLAQFRGMHAALVDGFAEVASPKVTRLLERIAKAKEVPDRAKAALAARGA